MTHRLIVGEEAEAEALEAAQWYELHAPGLGAELVETIEITLARIAENPLQFPVVYRGVRRALMRRFPYGIFFRVHPSHIKIVAIMHHSRDPNRWRGRR